MIKQQYVIYLIFIICIILILCYYKYIINEEFYVISKIKKSQSNSTLLNRFTDNDINDSFTRNTANNQLIVLNDILTKYKTIDPGITISNTGKLCSQSIQNNTCKIMPNTNSSDPQCLINVNVPTSCSMFYNESENTLNNNININMQKYLDTFLAKVSSDIIVSNTDIDTKSKDMNNNIRNLIDKLTLENQQNTFIKYNVINLDEKQKNVENTIKDFEKLDSSVNINKYNFKNNLSKYNTNDTLATYYYNIIFYLIIAIIVIGIFYLLITELK